MRSRAWGVVGAALWLAACAGAVTRTRVPRVEPSSYQAPLPTLSGVVGGVPWQARSALAHEGITEAPERYVVIYPFEWTCDDAQPGSHRSAEHFVSVFVPWIEDVHVQPVDGTFDEDRLSRAGELTLLSRPRTRGGVARVRLEMLGDDPSADHVRGEIDVVDCAP